MRHKTVLQMQPEVSDASEILHLKLWDQTTFDYSLSGASGTNSGATVVDRGFAFDGSASYIYMPDLAAWDDTTITISAWIKLDATWAAAGYVSARATGAATDWRLYIDSTREIRISGGGGTIPKTTAKIPLSIWTLITATYNTTTCGAYINGVTSALDGTTIEAIGVTAIKPTVGCRYNVEATPTVATLFKGDISDVRIYNEVRTAAQIKDFYEQTRWRYSV